MQGHKTAERQIQDTSRTSEEAQQRSLQNAKGTKFTIEAIRKYILTGITTSERRLRLKQTQSKIDHILQTCIAFRRMVAGRKDAPDIDVWLKLVYDCHCPRLTSFAGYTRGDKETVKNTCLTNYSNGIMEGTVNKIKVIKISMYNRANVELLRTKAIYGEYHPQKLTKNRFYFKYVGAREHLHIKKT